MNFLNQIRLGHKDNGPRAAKRLVDIYFALFKVSTSLYASFSFNSSFSWKDNNTRVPILQILISEAAAAPSTVQKERKAPHSSKVDKEKASSEPHIEMDSRLLSALLTVSNESTNCSSSSFGLG